MTVRRAMSLQEISSTYSAYNIQADDTIILNGGEPTVHSDILDIVRLAFRRGARVILFTNGRRLSDEAFAEQLVTAGIRKFTIPLYSDRAEIHDQITGVAYSHTQTLRGIGNIYRLKKGHFPELQIELKTLVCRSTLGQCAPVVNLIHSLFPAIDQFVLSGLIHSTVARDNKEVVSFREGIGTIEEAVECCLKRNSRLMLDSLPLCLLRKDILMGYLFRRRVSSVLEKTCYCEPANHSAEVVYLDSQHLGGDGNELYLQWHRCQCPFSSCTYHAFCRMHTQFLDNELLAELTPVLSEDSSRKPFASKVSSSQQTTLASVGRR